MKKLIVVSTKAEIGKGGISTALTGYFDGLDEQEIEYINVISHDGNKNTLLCWILAFFKVTYYAIKYRGQAVFWFHCAQWLSLFRKFTLAVIPRLLGSRTVGHIHSPAFNNYLNSKKTVVILTKISLLPYSSLIVLTPWWKSLLINHGITKPVTISANPNNQAYVEIAKQFIAFPKKVSDIDNGVHILSMARMVKDKGIEETLEALALLPEHFKLTIAGDGDKLLDFKLLTKRLGIENRVTFTGWINGEKKVELLKSADIFCLPSTYDSFGMVFIEAMAFDLPVIAYGWGPIVDVVTDDVGLCCKEVKAKEISQNILTISTQLERYSSAGPRKVLACYTPKACAANIIDLLN